MNCHRTGFGFDSHAFSKTGTLVLGGVLFPGTPALKGHSDGDALLHAIVDALLGAAALGDIGQLFPDTDAKNKGLSSRVMVRKAMDLLIINGYVVTNIDATVVADRPKLSSSRAEIQRRIAALVKLEPADIGVKGKTPEGLQWFGKAGGIAVWAVATITKA